MDQDRLRELLQSPLDDLPERRAPRQLLIGAAAIAGASAVIALGAWWLGSGDGSPGVTAASPAGPAPVEPGDIPEATGAAGDAAPGTSAPATTAPPPTVAAEVGFPDLGGLAAMAPTGPGRAVLFGGGLEQAAGGVVGRGFPEGELWSLDLGASRWERIDADPPLPGPRAGATLTPFGDGREMMLFGGSAAALRFCSPVPLCSTDLLDETWVFDSAGFTWEQVPAVGAPEPRVGHAAAYDAESGVIVLFGGAKPLEGRIQTGTNLDDTWAWDVEARTWQQMQPRESPRPRSYHAMAYDPDIDRVVVWGGDSSESGESDAQVWGYDYEEDRWEVLSVDTEPPEPPWYHSMVYVPDLGEMVVVGGWVPVVRDLGDGITATNVGPTDDVWALEAVTGAFRRLTPAPLPLAQLALAVVPEAGVVGYVGHGTWRYDPFTDEWDDLTVELGGDPDH